MPPTKPDISFLNYKPILLRVSNVTHFSGCKRRWWLEQNFTNGRFTPAFFIGTGIHKGLEAYYFFNRDMYQGCNVVEMWAQEQKYKWDYVQTWQEAGGDDLVQEIYSYLNHYASFDSENALQGDILEDDEGPIIERRLTVPILDTNGTKMTDADGNEILLTGQCDLGLSRGDNIYIVDHKSFGVRTMADKPEEGLEVDDQLTAYAYLFWRSYGVIPRAVIYNVFVKQHPEEPAVLKNGQLSISKSQSTTSALFRQKMRDLDLPMTQQYLDYLGYLDQQGYGRYFQRWQSSRNEHELRAFERRLAYKTRDIVRLLEDPDAYAYSDGSSYRCGGCPFIAPCKAMDDGGDAQAILDNQFERKELWSIES